MNKNDYNKKLSKEEEKNGLVEITPEMAEQYLRTSYRPVRMECRTTVNKYKEEMLAGKWGYSVDPIAFDTDGELINGRLRLQALKEAGVTLKFFVLRNCPKNMSHIDMGSRRSMATNIRLSNPNIDWNQNPAVATMNFINKMFPKVIGIETDDFAEYAEEFEGDIKLVQDGLIGAKQGLNCAAIRAGFTIPAIAGADKGLIEEGLRIFKDPEYKSRSRLVNGNFHELREYCISEMVSKGKTSKVVARLFGVIGNVIKTTEQRKPVGEINTNPIWAEMAYQYPVFTIEDNAVKYAYEPIRTKKTKKVGNKKTKKGGNKNK